MEALCVRPVEEERMRTGEERRGESGEGREWGAEASSPTGFITDEEADEDTEPEPRPVVRRRVSFADAFGLNLVSVKEFDDVEATGSEVGEPNEREARRPSEEFYMSCLFTVPSSPQDLDQRLQVQMVELESVELLPGTSTLRGITRVVNLCYSKSVYVRITSDRWNSYFDLPAEYVPGSSDRKTDRFTFKYTVALPLEIEGTRVEFCLRYETSVGTFWANNKGMNYVIFCHQKGHVKEQEGSSRKSKRGCLKAKRRGIAAERTKEMINRAAFAAEAEAPHEAAEADRKAVDRAETHTLSHHEEHKPLVDRIKSRQRTARVERTKDASFNEKKRGNRSPRVLTYHQIPLITLDWDSDKPQQWATPNADDIWTERATLASKVPGPPSVNDVWETFLNGEGVGACEETSVCDAWQAFVNVSGCTDHSSVPESEWLQTAASVSPSNDKEPQCAAPRWRGRESQSQTLNPAASQLPPPGTSPAIVASNTEGRRPAGERVGEMDTVTATPESPNASADDRISHAGSVEEALSSSGEAEVTGTAHNATDDTLAFVFAAPRLAAEEGIGRNGAGHKEDVIFRPRKTDEHEVSRRNADENQSQGLKQNGEKPLKQRERDGNTKRHLQSGADEVDVNQTCESHRDGWEIEDVARYVQKTEVVVSTSSSKADGQEMIQLLGLESDNEQEAPAEKNMDADGALTSDRGGRHQESCAVEPPEQTTPAVESGQPDDLFTPCLKDKYDPNLVEVFEMTRSRSKELMKGQDENSERSREDAAAKENDTSMEQRETSGRKEEDLSQRDKDLGGSMRKSKPAAVGELMGNVENPQGGSDRATAELKELSAKVESSPRVECDKASEGTGGTASVQVTEARLDEFSERSGEDLGRASMEEVFGEKTDGQASFGDISTVGGVNRHPSGLSTEEPPADADPSLSRRQTFPEAAVALSQTPTNWSPSGDPSHNHDSDAAVQRRQPPNDQGPDTLQRTRRPKHDSPSESDGLVWWTMLYIVSHVTRLLLCSLAVVGFVVLVLLYDFPAVFALYVFTVCWWFYKWKTHQGPANKMMMG